MLDVDVNEMCMMKTRNAQIGGRATNAAAFRIPSKGKDVSSLSLLLLSLLQFLRLIVSFDDFWLECIAFVFVVVL
jgi:hypothetical protein